MHFWHFHPRLVEIYAVFGVSFGQMLMEFSSSGTIRLLSSSRIERYQVEVCGSPGRRAAAQNVPAWNAQIQRLDMSRKNKILQILMRKARVRPLLIQLDEPNWMVPLGALSDVWLMNRSQERVHPPPFHDHGLLDILNTWLVLKFKKNIYFRWFGTYLRRSDRDGRVL